jgi:hypothetical protein
VQNLKPRLILHDFSGEQAERILCGIDSRDFVFAAKPQVSPCASCNFGCWFRTPGTCVIPDRARDFVAIIHKYDEFLVISRLVFGGLSPEVKAILDRSIGYLLPFFTMAGGEMHHAQRYKTEIELKYYLYGEDIADIDRKIATALIRANGKNFAAKHEIKFFHSPEALGLEL